MRKSKRIISAMLSLIMALLVFAESAAAAEIEEHESSEAAGALWADGNPNVESNDKNALDVVKWFSENDKGKGVNDLGGSSEHYYLFLPTTADLNNLTVWHSFETNPTVNGTAIENGSATSVFSSEGDYGMSVGEKTYTVTVMKSKFIGSMYIATESGNMNYVHADKENKESGDILVVQADGTVDYDKPLDQIKGRGNTTWTNMEKKPYNIKLNKKASLLGMDASKKWCLLANGQDHSLIRNKVAYDLASEVGLTYSPDSEYVDLYLNNEYVGVYQVTEKVEIGDNNLVKINDLEGATEEVNENELDTYNRHNGGTRAGRKNYYEIPNNPDDITGGYLLEYEVESKYNDEASGFVTNRGQFVVVKGPEFASKEQVDYISSFVQDMEDAIYSSNGYNSKGKHYTDYIDAESAALMYLVQEYSVNIDCGITSCFFYKDSDLTGDGKIHAGPAWDFDVSFGNLENTKDGVSMKSTDKWFAKNTYQYGNGQKTVFAALCSHSDFMDLVKELYNSKFAPALEVLNSSDSVVSEHIKSTAQYQTELESSAAMNFNRWAIEDNLLVSSAGKTYESQMNYLKKFLTARAEFLNKGFGGSTDTDTDTDTDEKLTVYFDNTVHNWDEVYIYFWGDTASKEWPGAKMTDLENGVFKYEFSDASDASKLNIIFNNGYGKGSQTVNLTPVNNNIFTPNDKYSEIKEDEEAKKYIYDGDWHEYKDNPVNSYIMGDLNNDGKITASDALVVLRASVGERKLSDIESKLADVNNDGKILASDALLILRYSVGIPDIDIVGQRVTF